MNLEKANPELFKAIAAAQGEVENATKSSSNPHFKSKYADLAEVLNTVRPVFAKHGLGILQSTEFNGELVSVTTTITHDSGGYVSSTASCVPAKTDGQGIGSATTYLRRYSLASMTGVAQEDDDGQSSAHDKKPAAIGQAEKMAIAEWSEAFKTADTAESLDSLASQLATSNLSPASKQALRVVYSEAKGKFAKVAA
jgi:ERF superfamily